MSRKAVFLDRDGVLNQPIIRDGKPFPPATIEETTIPANTRQSLLRLKSRGFLLIVVTNQPDVSRRTCTRQDVEQIHRWLSSKLPLDDFFVCYHDDADDCGCRKPLPGLLFDAAAQYSIDLLHSYMVGDRWRDIEAGASAACRTILIDYRYTERRSKHLPDATVSSLPEAVDWILEQEGNV